MGHERALLDRYPVLSGLCNARWFGTSIDTWLQQVLSIHFDPVIGSRYWLQKEKTLGINARRDISSLSELCLLGPMEEEDLRRYPIEHFIPEIYLRNKEDLILGETAGTTGFPKVTAYLKDEFFTAFVEWFRYVAVQRGFPRGVNWLWVGPSGPHIIGKAVGPVARSMGSMSPFSIDLDPRWIKKFKPNSLGYKRYLSHIVEQALDILKRQYIGVIFTTPPLLMHLAGEMDVEQRMQIQGIHYGGVALEKEQLKRFKTDLFPNAIHIAGYGNTLFGLCMEIDESGDFDLDYYPPGPRLVLQVVSTKDGVRPVQHRLSQIVEYGKKGQVVCHRLDESFFIPNMFERDEAIRIAATKKTRLLGIYQDGIRNPSLLQELRERARPGVY
ncbi:MAG: hypothetical protein ACUBOA_01445 [Candidatus Loosdrechtia sp.]|uniref:hypothetical protein n=1 Tax=Candidatus Loosdrechtia sp. TaxID=3101272 RepID=UPI003A76E6EE|nr:MAG: hypothetical protein QY305_07335 [Candidatus Jettenia sp. AMX2]